MENEVQWVTGIEIGHIDMEAIRPAIWDKDANISYLRKERLGLPHEIVFPQKVQSTELIMVISQHYNEATRQCLDGKGNVIMDLSTTMIAQTFKILQFDQSLQDT